jgi:hypothetical protein
MLWPTRVKGALAPLFLTAFFSAGIAHSSPQVAAVAFSLPTANPNTITAGAPASVSVMVRVFGRPSRVWLERLSSPNATSGTVITNLAGRDGVYSAQIQFNEPSAGTIFLQVAAVFPAAGELAHANVQPLRSQVISVRVVARSSGGPSPGEIAAIGGAPAVVPAVVRDWPNQHHLHVPNPDAGQTLQRSGLTFRFPPDWQLNPAVPEGGPISLNTFNSQYLQGGIIPAGGADIDIAYFPGPSGSVQQIMAEDLADAEEEAIDPRGFLVGGTNGRRVSYTDTYTPNLVYKTIAVYVPAGAGLYKFYLTYHKGDPQEAQFIADYERILQSVRFSR